MHQQMLWQQQQLPLNSTAALMADVAQTLQDIRVQQQDIAMSKWQERYYTNQAIMRGVNPTPTHSLLQEQHMTFLKELFATAPRIQELQKLLGNAADPLAGTEQPSARHHSRLAGTPSCDVVVDADVSCELVLDLDIRTTLVVEDQFQEDVALDVGTATACGGAVDRVKVLGDTGPELASPAITTKPSPMTDSGGFLMPGPSPLSPASQPLPPSCPPAPPPDSSQALPPASSPAPPPPSSPLPPPVSPPALSPKLFDKRAPGSPAPPAPAPEEEEKEDEQKQEEEEEQKQEEEEEEEQKQQRKQEKEEPSPSGAPERVESRVSSSSSSVVMVSPRMYASQVSQTMSEVDREMEELYASRDNTDQIPSPLVKAMTPSEGLFVSAESPRLSPPGVCERERE